MKNKVKEYNHFVPQFYLKNFSNNKKSIGIYRFKEHKFIENASIKENCGRKFLYGKEDTNIEDWFGKLEGIWSNIFSKIIENEKIDYLNIDEITYIYMFIYLTDVRNAETADYNNLLLRETIKNTVLLTKEHKPDDKYGKLDLSILKNLSYDKPNLINIQNMPNIVDCMSDLKLILIKNNSNTQFITSDCPVAKYNKFFIEREYKGRSYGYGQMGFQCFVTISPKLCLCLIDEVLYDFKLEQNNLLLVNGVDIVNDINNLIVNNSDEYIIFNNLEKRWKIEKITGLKKKIEHTPYSLGNPKQGYITVIQQRCVKQKIKLLFLLVKKGFMNIPLPLHMAGPLRPNATEIIEKIKRKSKKE